MGGGTEIIKPRSEGVDQHTVTGGGPIEGHRRGDPAGGPQIGIGNRHPLSAQGKAAVLRTAAEEVLVWRKGQPSGPRLTCVVPTGQMQIDDGTMGPADVQRPMGLFPIGLVGIGGGQGVAIVVDHDRRLIRLPAAAGGDGVVAVFIHLDVRWNSRPIWEVVSLADPHPYNMVIHPAQLPVQFGGSDTEYSVMIRFLLNGLRILDHENQLPFLFS